MTGRKRIVPKKKNSSDGKWHIPQRGDLTGLVGSIVVSTGLTFLPNVDSLETRTALIAGMSSMYGIGRAREHGVRDGARGAAIVAFGSTLGQFIGYITQYHM